MEVMKEGVIRKIVWVRVVLIDIRKSVFEINKKLINYLRGVMFRGGVFCFLGVCEWSKVKGIGIWLGKLNIISIF